MTATPGPWEMHLAGEYWLEITTHATIEKPRVTVCEIWEHEDSDPDIAEANARLIAAAPALLEACEYALSVYENITSVGFVSYENRPARDVLRAAIAQAKGLVAHEEVSCDNP